MRKAPLVAAYVFAAMLIQDSRQSRAASTYDNPILGYTHLLPSPYTLPAGRFSFGTDLAYGITDFLQVGTSLLYDVFQIYNVNARVSLLDMPGFSFALTGAFESYNLQSLDSSNPNIAVTSLLPGAVAGFALTPELGWLVGGNLNFSSQTINLNGINVSGFTRGAAAESDLSWAAITSRKGWPLFVISGGVSYDFTYQLAGVGVSFHVKGFHLGVHYYPAAVDDKWLPIIAGGAVVDL